MAVAGLPGDRLNAVLDVSALPAGTYRVEAVLKSGPEAQARRLGTAVTSMTRMVGPFD